MTADSTSADPRADRAIPDAAAGERAMVKAANEVVAESAAKDPFTRRVYEAWSRFRAKAIALAPLTELGFMSIRDRFT